MKPLATGMVVAGAVGAAAAGVTAIAAVESVGSEAQLTVGRMQKALENGNLPLSISAANIEPAGPGAAATADITATGPKLQQHSVNLKFVDQDGWKLAHSALRMLSRMSSN